MSTFTTYWKPSDPDWHLVAIPARPWQRLYVKAVDGEPNRYWVESESLRCVACNKNFDAKYAARHRLESGDKCPKCGDGELERFWYVTDLSDYKLHGSCSCPHFTGTLAKELSKEKPETWIMGQHQCKHIQAAIALSSLIHVELMERERYKSRPKARRQEGVGA